MWQNFWGGKGGMEERKTLKTKIYCQDSPVSAYFGSADSKIGMIRRSARPLCKGDMQILKHFIFCFAFLMFKGRITKALISEMTYPTEDTSCFKPDPRFSLQKKKVSPVTEFSNPLNVYPLCCSEDIQHLF